MPATTYPNGPVTNNSQGRTSSTGCGITRILYPLVALAALSIGIACKKDAAPRVDERRLLETPKPEVPSVGDIAALAEDKDRLTKLLLTPHSRTADALVPYSLKTTHKLAVSGEDSEQLEELVETYSLTVDDERRFVASYSNSREYGREVYSDGNYLWLRLGHGRFHKRVPTTPAEPNILRDEFAGVLRADLELLLPHLRISTSKGIVADGSAAYELVLEPVSGGAGKPIGKNPASWRETVELLEGRFELLIEQESGTILKGTWSAKLVFERDGVPLTMDLTGDHQLAQNVDFQFEAPSPEQSINTPTRDEQFEEKDTILKGLIPGSGNKAE